ncbi:MAG: hypothetical protein JWM93_430 [Frankiales bacterium]|nr:hypothetical protein [Frankiales bacterium]
MAVQAPIQSAPLPPAAAGLMHSARMTLREAAWEQDPAQRFATAHLAALRAAAVVLAARARVDGRSRRRPSSAWVLLGSVAPELVEWASFFAAGAAKRAAAEAGLSDAATQREADDLVRDVELFLSVVERSVGLAA